MTAALAVALVAMVVAAVALTSAVDRRRRAAVRRIAKLEARLASTEAAAERASASALEARASLEHARALAETAQTAAVEASRGAQVAAGTVETLWSLARHDLQLERRRAAALSSALDVEEGCSSASAAVEAEVERVREEVGTPGSFRVELADQARAATSLLALAAARALLGAVARRCDGFDLYVHEWGGALAAVVVCEGYSGPEDLGSDGSSLRTALSRTGGRLAVDRDDRGRLRARLRVPVPAPGQPA